MQKLEQPLNANERYLYGISIRLEVLIDMFSSFLEVYAEQNKVATTSNTVEEVYETEDSENVSVELADIDGIDAYDVEINKLNVSDIKKILDAKGIKYTARMRKSELISLL